MWLRLRDKPNGADAHLWTACGFLGVSMVLCNLQVFAVFSKSCDSQVLSQRIFEVFIAETGVGPWMVLPRNWLFKPESVSVFPVQKRWTTCARLQGQDANVPNSSRIAKLVV